MAISNAMACIVFRKIKLGLISDDGSILGPIITSDHTTSHPNSIPLRFSRGPGRGSAQQEDSGDRYSFSRGGDLSTQNPITIEVQITEERDVSDMSIRKAVSTLDL
jgi:hypothetical protein